MNWLRRDEGLKSSELGIGLFVMALIVAVAIPSISALLRNVDQVASTLEVRNVSVPVRVAQITGDEVDAAVEEGAQVAGVTLERSADGGICVWKQSAAGNVVGIWQSETEVLRGVFVERPDHCPTRQEALAFGFAASEGG